MDTATACRFMLPDIVADVRVIILVIRSADRQQSFDVHHRGAEFLLHRLGSSTFRVRVAVCRPIGVLVASTSDRACGAANGMRVPSKWAGIWAKPSRWKRRSREG